MPSVTTKKPTDDFRRFVLEQLGDLPGLTCRAMFGGHGLYQHEHFFGIVHKGRLYFKTNESSRKAYEAHEMGSFRPNEKQNLKNYYEVPVAILEDPKQLTHWAHQAIAIHAS